MPLKPSMLHGTPPADPISEPADEPYIEPSNKPAGEQTSELPKEPAIINPDNNNDSASAITQQCHEMVFKNKELLSQIVRRFVVQCYELDVFWKLGAPGDYTDYQIQHTTTIPIAGLNDMLELLETHFGIRGVQHDNQIFFYDQHVTPVGRVDLVF